MKYKNKSMIIDAFKWTGDQDQVEDPIWIVEAIKKGEVSFADLSSNPYKRNVKMIIILNKKNYVIVDQGDYVVQTSDGKIISYRADTFEETFELVND